MEVNEQKNQWSFNPISRLDNHWSRLEMGLVRSWVGAKLGLEIGVVFRVGVGIS